MIHVERMVMTYHQWRTTAGVASKIGLAAGFAVLTGLFAQVVLRLPWTPVPITGQTFAVLLAGVVLGRWGAISQLLYVGAGLLGVPWFAEGKGGIEVLMGPTFGYCIGFVVTAYAVGYLVDTWPAMRRWTSLIAVMVAANFFIIFGFGLAYLYVWIGAVKGSAPELMTLLVMGFFPFLPGAVVKTLLAAAAARVMLPGDRVS